MSIITTSTENTLIKEWYKNTFPTDDLKETLNPTLTFNDLFRVMDNYGNVYESIFADDTIDSLVRERIFTELAHVMQVDYNYIYDQWTLCKG